MIQINRSEINPIKMCTNPLDQIVNAEMRVISNGDVYQYVGIGWIYLREANKEDFNKIPEITD